MGEDDILAFAANVFPSLWALELLFLLKEKGPPGLSQDELVRELRSSTTAVHESLIRLQAAGLVVETGTQYHYRPASSALDDFVAALQRLYAVKPAAVMKAIVSSKNESLQRFANAFRIKE